MNKYQKIVFIVAALDIGLMLLFPPTLDAPLVRGSVSSFAGYQPFFALDHGHRVFDGLLAIQCLYIGANALAAYLAVSRAGTRDLPQGRIALGVGAFVAVNAAVIGLFPPFETYSGLLKHLVPTFDGFYFVFGERSRRALFEPILYLEGVLLAANALTIWLLFGLVGEGRRASAHAILDLARQLPPDEAMRLSEEILRQTATRHGRNAKADGRRQEAPADYEGGERRQRNDRRRQPR